MADTNDPTGKVRLFGGDAPLDAGKLRSALRDIVGHEPKEIAIEFDKDRPGLGPGGIRAGDASWDGNVYKYRY